MIMHVFIDIFFLFFIEILDMVSRLLTLITFIYTHRTVKPHRVIT